MFVFLRLLAEWALCKGGAIASLRLPRRSRLMVVAPLRIESRFLVWLRRPFAEAFVVMLSHLVVPGLVVPARVDLLRLVDMGGPIDTRTGRRFAARTVGEAFDMDVVLVGPLNLGGKTLGRLPGDFEFGDALINPDRADVVLVDAAAAADHRQQPPGFGILAPSDAGAEPDAAAFHAAAKTRLLRMNSSTALVAARSVGRA